ncbi:hypothetical protein GQ44DRAFT_692707 [Phaeosphaeriaceae sp. PMI808]|nr:hypothetical protein GQ44DRAFT_692707 [Phaeosphaeriaceae sp. PMI808]
MHIAIVCACLPAGKPFLRKHFPQVIESVLSASSATKKQTLRSNIVLKPSVRDGDEIPLNEVLGHSLDGGSQTNVSSHTTEYVESPPHGTM